MKTTETPGKEQKGGRAGSQTSSLVPLLQVIENCLFTVVGTEFEVCVLRFLTLDPPGKA